MRNFEALYGLFYVMVMTVILVNIKSALRQNNLSTQFQMFYLLNITKKTIINFIENNDTKYLPTYEIDLTDFFAYYADFELTELNGTVQKT